MSMACSHFAITLIARPHQGCRAGASIPRGGWTLPSPLTAMTRLQSVQSARHGDERSGPRRPLGAKRPAAAVGAPLDADRLPQHLDRLFRAAVVMTGSRQEAEDLVQETCVRVLRRPRFLRKDDDLAYLMRAMRNAWLNIRRGRGAEARALQETAVMLERSPAPDPMLSVEAHALLAAVSELPPIYRDVIAAVDVLGLSYKEAAKALRTREGTVMSRLFRARVHVGDALGRDD
jgi:RNA polymerase sigma-70 factor (ECF subfamily)